MNSSASQKFSAAAISDADPADITLMTLIFTWTISHEIQRMRNWGKLTVNRVKGQDLVSFNGIHVITNKSRFKDSFSLRCLGTNLSNPGSNPSIS